MKKFVVAVFCLFSVSLCLAQSRQDPNRINWPLITGTGTPTALSKLCTTGAAGNVGQPYQDISVVPNVRYHCSTTGWALDSTGGGVSGVPYPDPSTNYVFTGDSRVTHSGVCDSGGWNNIAISAWSITSNVATVTYSTNPSLTPPGGAVYVLNGFTTGSFFNNQIVTQLADGTGGGSGTFQFNLQTPHADATGSESSARVMCYYNYPGVVMRQPFFSAGGTAVNYDHEYNEGYPQDTGLAGIGGSYPAGSIQAMLDSYVPYIHPRSPAVTGHPAYLFVSLEADSLVQFGYSCPAQATYESQYSTLFKQAHIDGFIVVAMTYTALQTGAVGACADPMGEMRAYNTWLRNQSPTSTTIAPTCTTHCGENWDYLVDVANAIPSLIQTNMGNPDGEHYNENGSVTVAGLLNSALANQGSPPIANPKCGPYLDIVCYNEDNNLGGNFNALSVGVGQNPITGLSTLPYLLMGIATNGGHSWPYLSASMTGTTFSNHAWVSFQDQTSGGNGLTLPAQGSFCMNSVTGWGVLAVGAYGDTCLSRTAGIPGEMAVGNGNGWGDFSGGLKSTYLLGPATAPSGSCTSAQGGHWRMTQDGAITRCPVGGGTWTTFAGGGMVYPSAGMAKSTGSAWATPTYADIVAMWASGSCTSGYLKFDGTCSTPSGGGTVSTTGSPVSGDLAAFSSPTDITTATATQVNTLIKTLSGCNTATYLYSPQSGTCVAPSGGGSSAWVIDEMYSNNLNITTQPSGPFGWVATLGGASTVGPAQSCGTICDGKQGVWRIQSSTAANSSGNMQNLTGGGNFNDVNISTTSGINKVAFSIYNTNISGVQDVFGLSANIAPNPGTNISFVCDPANHSASNNWFARWDATASDDINTGVSCNAGLWHQFEFVINNLTATYYIDNVSVASHAVTAATYGLYLVSWNNAGGTVGPLYVDWVAMPSAGLAATFQ